MSDEQDAAPTGPPATMEVHINLGSPELRDREGALDPAAVARLLSVLQEVIPESLPSQAKGLVMSQDTGQPMAYWVYTYKEDR